MWPVTPLQVNEFLNKRQGYVWYQDDISLAEDRLAGIFQFVTTGRKKLKHPNKIDDKQRKELDKKDVRRISTLQMPKKLCH